MTYTRSAVALLLATAIACGGSQKTEGTDDSTETDDDRVSMGDDRPMDRRSRAPGDDEDDGDPNLQVEGLKGHLEPYDIRQGVEPHSGAVSSCFDSRAKKKKFLGGNVELAYLVATDGSVKNVQIAKSDLGAWEVEKCLLEVARAMTFVKPKGGEAEFSLPLEFPARRQALWWSEEQAETTVGEKVAELAACEPVPENVWVTFYVGVGGAVQSVGFASPAETPIDPGWADCASGVVGAWTLIDPRGKIAKGGFRFNPE